MTKECVLIIDTASGEAVLERISNSIQLKAIRWALDVIILVVLSLCRVYKIVVYIVYRLVQNTTYVMHDVQGVKVHYPLCLYSHVKYLD